MEIDVPELPCHAPGKGHEYRQVFLGPKIVMLGPSMHASKTTQPAWGSFGKYVKRRTRQCVLALGNGRS